MSETYEVLFSSSIRLYKACVMFKKVPYNLTDIVWETSCNDCLCYSADAFESPTGRQEKSIKVKTVSLVDHKYDRWHARLGHISAYKYRRAASVMPELPALENSILSGLQCFPCLTAKMFKVPVRHTDGVIQQSAEIHYELSGPFQQVLGGKSYVVHLLEAPTAKSDLYMVNSKDQVCATVKAYIAYIENHFCTQRARVKVLRSDKAGKNLTADLLNFLANAGISVKTSPAYAPESNGLAERLVQEHWNRARVFMFATDLPKTLWGEAMAHTNWLRNRVPSARVNFHTPLEAFDVNARIDLSQVLEFGA